MTRSPSVLRFLAATVPALTLSAGLSACGGTASGAAGAPNDRGAAEVVLGGTSAAAAPTLDRPWGRVPAVPEMEAAETPGQADVAFAQQMIVHHRQAMEISRNTLALDPTDERITASARFIELDQKTEIAVMASWLEAWEAEPAPSGPGSHRGMPGMVPQRAVDALARRDAAAGQVDFLVLMLEHHRGAVQMSTDYLDVSLNSYTLSIAKHVIREQEIEIDWMTGVLAELCAGPDAVSTCP
jgi:uncharacterized protein (DUF305 family)